MDLMQAFHSLNDEKTALVFLGDGELRKEMEEYISKHNLRDVYLTGFKNQSEVGKYFAAADIFVLPSGPGETWGLVVNEAMNFGLAIVVSDMIGCAEDLILEKINGFIFRYGNIDNLEEKLKLLITNDALRLKFGLKAPEILKNYSYEIIMKSFKQIQ